MSENLTFKTTVTIPMGKGTPEIDKRTQGGLFFDIYRTFAERFREERNQPKFSDAELLARILNAHFCTMKWDRLLAICQDAIVWKVKETRTNESRAKHGVSLVDVSDERIFKAVKAKIKKDKSLEGVVYDDQVLMDMLMWIECIVMGEDL